MRLSCNSTERYHIEIQIHAFKHRYSGTLKGESIDNYDIFFTILLMNCGWFDMKCLLACHKCTSRRENIVSILENIKKKKKNCRIKLYPSIYPCRA